MIESVSLEALEAWKAKLAKRAGRDTAKVAWCYNPGPQHAFLSCGAFEVLYGGQAGGSKTESLLLNSLRHVDKPHYRAILFRRTFPEIEKSLIHRSLEIIPLAFPKARYRSDKHYWRFPSGARLYFSHLEYEDSVLAHQSAEYQYLGFDELTHFTQKQYTYMISRARSSHGIPIRIRSATNPGGEGADWVFARWAPWLDTRPEYAGPRAKPGEVLWYCTTRGVEDYVLKGTPKSLSRVFFPARLEDTPQLYYGDPEYDTRLEGLDPVTYEQLRGGNWLARPAKGLYFKRAWIPLVDVAPAQGQRVRWWDRAATEAKKGKDPDWTIGLKLCRTHDRLLWVEDVVRLRGHPHEVEETIKRTAQLDGRGVKIALAEDPGSAGKFETAYYLKALQGYTVEAYRETGDKIARAGPVSSQAKAGNLRIVQGTWNQAFLAEIEAFPEGGHDDQVDALSGAFSVLAQQDLEVGTARRQGW